MAWRRASASDFVSLECFLRKREHRAVLPSERLREIGVGRTLRHKFYVTDNGETVGAVVYAGAGGLYFPIDLDIETDGKPPLSDAWHPIHSIMGATDDVLGLERALREVPVHRMRYHTMTLEPSGYPVVPDPPVENLDVYQPDTSDWRRLLPLQVAYEQEEVVLPGRRVNASVSRSTLIDSLQHQLVIVAVYGGKPIARVATNARGFACDQIGGVYTVPSFRRQGVSKWLMKILLHQLGQKQRKASLFVKPHNEPALALYRSLGFNIEGEFAIHYY